jgi:signal transduction histidine kinase
MKSSQPARAVESFYGNRLFEGVDVDVIERFAPKIDILRKKRGEVIFRTGEPGDAIYLVGQGLVSISNPADISGPPVVDYVDQGNFFGATALLVGEPRSTTAIAEQPALIGEVKEEALQELFELAPNRLHMNFLRAVIARFRSANDQFIREAVRSERMRVAGALANSIVGDLKNPVCIARCCADVIASESTDPQLRELTSILADSLNAILGKTSDLLDYTRNSFSLNKRPVSIWRLLDELNTHFLHLLPGKNIEFAKQIRYQGNIEIDLARFVRALGNVIENSMQAMPSGGVLTFTVDLIENVVAIRISDTGWGIAPELLPRLFEPLEVCDNLDGARVGLPVTKAIVEAHGGRISLRSVVAKGTTVDIRLPKPAIQ